MSEREPIGDRETLVRLAGDVGLDPDRVRSTLASDRFASEVRADEELAHSLQIHGVPFFVMGAAIGLSGAQTSDVMVRALDEAWRRVAAERETEQGAVCGPEGCA